MTPINNGNVPSPPKQIIRPASCTSFTKSKENRNFECFEVPKVEGKEKEEEDMEKMMNRLQKQLLVNLELGAGEV